MTNGQSGQPTNASSKRKLGRARPPHFKHGVQIDALAQDTDAWSRQYNQMGRKSVAKRAFKWIPKDRADARIIETAGRVSDTIVFGATVLVIEQESQSKREYTLVGQDEADMKVNRISIQSPVGKALIGKRVGDFVEVKTPVKMVEYEVVEIRFEEL